MSLRVEYDEAEEKIDLGTSVEIFNAFEIQEVVGEFSNMGRLDVTL